MSRPAERSISALRLPSLSSSGRVRVTRFSSKLQLNRHQPNHWSGAVTNSSSPSRRSCQFSALTPSVRRVAWLTLLNSRLNSEALASRFTPVMPVVSAVRLADPRLKLVADEKTAVAATANRMNPPMIAMMSMIGLVAPERGGSGLCIGAFYEVWMVSWMLMSFPVWAAGRTVAHDFRDVPGQQVRGGCRYHRHRVRVFGRSR